jgi:uncharacterized membrane protein HdeD (DUF308 family)
LQVVLGAVAMALPFIAVLYFGIVMGLVLIASGLFQLIAAARNRSWSKALLGLVPLAAGSLVFSDRQLGFSFLVAIFAVYLFFSGVSRLVFGRRHRTMPEWKIALAGGLYGILLGILTLAGWPGNTALSMGLFVGSNILFGGVLNILFADRGTLVI